MLPVCRSFLSLKQCVENLVLIQSVYKGSTLWQDSTKLASITYAPVILQNSIREQSFVVKEFEIGAFSPVKPTMATNENLPPNVIKQLARELKNLDETPPEGIKVGVNDDDFSVIFADIEGPAGTPYENGVFRMKLILSRDFPQTPPKGYFLTKIFHPNIATNGDICVNALKKDWNPNLGLRHVLIVIRCLLIEPFPESALNEQAGKMLLQNYDEYAKHARIYTGIHATKPKAKSKIGAISESTTAINVDPTIVKSIEEKNAVQLALPLAPKLENCQDRTAVITSSNGTGVSGSTAQKKDAGLGKVTADKRKIDARKKSLKRL